MKKSIIFVMVMLVMAVCLPVSSDGATEIPIDNPGFEYPPLADGDWAYSMDDEGWGYYNNNGEIGPWNVTKSDYTKEAPEGQNVGWTCSGETAPGGFAQVLLAPEAELKAGRTYTLTVKVGRAKTYPYVGYKVQLLAGGTPHTPGTGGNYTGAVVGGTLLAEDDNSQTMDMGTFVTSTVTYTYNPALHSDLLGEQLQIRLIALGGWVNWEEVEFDDVRLSYNASIASNPIPADGAVDVPVETNLSWTRGQYCIQDDVYFGTDPCMANLPKVATLFDYQPALVDLPEDLVASRTYYWYVVETDSNEPHAPVTPWSFATVRGEATLDFPPDGAVIPGATVGDDIYTALDFFSGTTTVKYTGYFHYDYAKVASRAEDANLGDPPYFPDLRYYAGLYAVEPWTESLVRGTVYYWAVDSEDARGNMFPGEVWEFTIQGYYAFAPNPSDGAIFVPSDAFLAWKPGYGVAVVDGHDIYLGTSYEAVRDARYDFNEPSDSNGDPYVGPDEYYMTRSEPNVLVPGLPYLTTHYWRVDEVNGRLPPPFGGGTYYFGLVWSFTTQGPITGLTGEYYHHSGGASPAGFETKMLVRVDPQIDFDWGNPGAPDPVMSVDDFSVRWTGQIAVPVAGTYTFTTETDDGVRLWINDTLIIDQWINQSPTIWSGSIELNSFGPHDIRMEYYEDGGGAVARLNWQGPSAPYGIVPSNYLAPNYDAFTAANPRPRDGYLEPNPQPTLTWTPGAFAATHELYFSTDFDAVNERTAPKMVLTASSYALSASLDMDQTYYWAVDEVNSVGPAPGFWPGDVWSFIIPLNGTGRAVREWWFGISGTAITNLTSSPSYPDWPTGWEYVDILEGPVNWADNYGSRISGWLRPPTTGDYTFWIATDDNGELWLSTSEDPADANKISWVSAWAPSRGFDDPDVYPSSPITLQANKKYYISALMKEGSGGDNIAVAWQGPDPISARQVIDGRYLCATPFDPPYANNPNPPVGATVDDRTPLLSWWPGVYTQSVNGHKLYFSTNRDDVNDRSPSAFMATLTEPNYPYPTPLLLGQTYYWAVDEVNSLGPVPGLWSGRLWSFTMAECISVDNFEDYTDRGELRLVWTDGFASVAWGGVYPSHYPLNTASSGSNLDTSTSTTVGSPYSATGPIQGGDQAMVLRYDNDGDTYPVPGEEDWVYQAQYFSEVEANTVENLDVGRDWSSEGVKALSLWFQGHPLSDGGYDATGWPVYTVSGRGRDIGGRHDEFFFLGSYPLTGSGIIQVKVTSIEDTDPWAKAGIMIREKLAPCSKFAAVYMTPGSGVTFQWRENEGSVCESRTKPGVTVPQYLKLERTVSGNFIAKHSEDLSVWLDVNSTTASAQPLIPMGTIENPNIYVGTAVTSHDAMETCTAGFDTVEVIATPAPTTWVFGNIGTNDANQLYVALSDSTKTVVVNHPDPYAVNLTEWQEWNIELTEFGGLNLSDVRKVHIGVGDRVTHPDPGGSGVLYIDDIRACPPRCVLSLRSLDFARADFVEDCVVDYKELEVMAENWLAEIPIMIPIPIDNPGFEDSVLADGDYNYQHPDWGWFANNGNCGTWNPGFDTYEMGYGGDAPEGQNVGFTEPGVVPGGFAQVLTEKLQADTTYTLTVEVGNTLGYAWVGYSIQLLAGGTPGNTDEITVGTLLAEDDNSLTIEEDTFETSTVTYTYNPELHSHLLGEPLQIRLLSLGGGETDFDDVKLYRSYERVNLYEDMTINFKDYALIAEKYLEEFSWPTP